MAEPVNPKITKEPPKGAPVTSPKGNGAPMGKDEPVKGPEQIQQQVEDAGEISKVDEAKIKKKKTKLKMQDDYGDE